MSTIAPLAERVAASSHEGVREVAQRWRALDQEIARAEHDGARFVAPIEHAALVELGDAAAWRAGEISCEFEEAADRGVDVAAEVDILRELAEDIEALRREVRAGVPRQ